jgi:VMA21-like domain
MSFVFLAVYSVLLAGVPLLAFLSASHGRLDHLFLPFVAEVTDANRPICAGVIAVLCVNVVCFGAVAWAWNEKPLATATPQHTANDKKIT